MPARMAETLPCSDRGATISAVSVVVSEAITV